MFEKNFYLETSYVDEYLELKLSSLFLMMQDVATEHAEILGVGKNQTIDKNLFWVITRYSVSINKLPKYLDKVTVRTYPGKNMKFIFPRYFEVLSETGELLIKASSTWVVVDRDTHKVNMDPFHGQLLPEEHHEGEEELPIKVTKRETSLIENRVVRYSDIDLNRHLNNTRYIEYIVDSHDIDFYKTHRLKHIVINYEKEIKSGDVVSIKSNHENPEYLVGMLKDEISFETLIEYENR